MLNPQNVSASLMIFKKSFPFFLVFIKKNPFAEKKKNEQTKTNSWKRCTAEATAWQQDGLGADDRKTWKSRENVGDKNLAKKNCNKTLNKSTCLIYIRQDCVEHIYSNVLSLVNSTVELLKQHFKKNYNQFAPLTGKRFYLFWTVAPKILQASVTII